MLSPFPSLFLDPTPISPPHPLPRPPIPSPPSLGYSLHLPESPHNLTSKKKKKKKKRAAA
eukprot:EC688884.1.p1 GENE.EC688884.1~~EC688884.1.p1  ORF type:complete len:60 (+),score=8.21 EC688884.1:299-478(+)